VDDAVADRVGNGGVAQGSMPLPGRKLTGDDGGRPVVSVFEDFEEVATLGILQRRDEQIVQDEDLELREPSEHPGVCPIGASDRDFLEQARHACVKRPISAAACSLGQRGGEIALAAAGLPNADDVVPVGDPATGREVTNDGLGHAATLRRPDILKCRVVGQLRRA